MFCVGETLENEDKNPSWALQYQICVEIGTIMAFRVMNEAAQICIHNKVCS